MGGEIKFGVDTSKIAVVSGDEIMSLLQDLYDWMDEVEIRYEHVSALQTQDELLRRVGRILGK